MQVFNRGSFQLTQTSICYVKIYNFSQIQLVVYYQYNCVLIGWATSRLYVIAH